jgi:hypothetical protein
MHKPNARRSQAPTAASGMASGIPLCRAECRSAKFASPRSRNPRPSTSKPAQSGTKRMHKPNVRRSQRPVAHHRSGQDVGLRDSRTLPIGLNAPTPRNGGNSRRTANRSLRGAIVYRLGHRPFKAERRVRFPLALYEKRGFIEISAAFKSRRGPFGVPSNHERLLTIHSRRSPKAFTASFVASIMTCE